MANKHTHSATNGSGSSNGNGHRRNGNGAGSVGERTRRIPRLEAARAAGGSKPPKGRLILIGGAEDREGEMVILQQVAARARGGRLAVITAASSEPEQMWTLYRRVFDTLGVKDVAHVQIEDRDAAYDPANAQLLKTAKVIFFTGGDQVRITSMLGGSPLCDTIRKGYEDGVTLAGTSAGTSCMSETMLVGGNGDQSHKIGNALLMAPGLGLVSNVIIDQHFAERGRIGRLLGAVAQNPRILGIGIDENTAIVLKDGRFRVLGAGAVYVIDAISESYTNVSEEHPDKTMSVFDVRLHIMSANDTFDLATRRPSRAEADGPKPELFAADPARAHLANGA
jgi:cyanophycinase